MENFQNLGITPEFNKDEYIEKFIPLILEHAPRFDKFNIVDLKDKIPVSKTEKSIFLILSTDLKKILLENGYFKFSNGSNIKVCLTEKGRKYFDKVNDNKINVINNINNSTIGQLNQDSNFSESPISIKTKDIPSKNPEIKSKLNKLLSNPWFISISVAVFTAVLNGKRVMNFINNILDNI